MKTLNEWRSWFDTEAKNVQLVDRGIVDEILSTWENDLDYLIDYLDANKLKKESK